MADFARSFNMLSTDTLTGDAVRNSAGEDLGKIKDFMIDLDNGQIVYAVLSVGGFLGMGDKLFAIPWDALGVDLDRHNFILDVDRDMLEDAPGFDKNNWPATPDREFIDRVYTHYGYDPYSERGRVTESQRSSAASGEEVRSAEERSPGAESREGGRHTGGSEY